MRRLLTLLIAIMLIALPAASILVPASAQAAPALAVRQSTFTGRLVATPSITSLATSSSSVNLLVQDGSQTLLVRVTPFTRLVDRTYASITLADLHDRNLLRVTFRATGRRFGRTPLTATLIQNLSLPVAITVQVKGQLAAAPSSNILCLANGVITGASTPRAQVQVASSCPSGLLPVYLTNNTKIQNQAGGSIPLSALQAGDMLQVTTSLVNNQLIATLIKDITLQVSTPIQVKGQLVAAPNPATVPPSGILCVANTVITGASTPRAFAQVASPCSGGQLPVYLTSSTQIQDQSGGSAILSELLAGDTLQITAALTNGQVVASLVQDLTLAAPTVQVKGQLASAPSSNLLCVVNTVITGASAPRAKAQIASPCPSGWLPIYLNNATQFQDQTGAAATLAALHLNDTLQITATLINGQLTASLVKDLSVVVGVPAPDTITGTIVATPQATTVPATLLLQVDNQTILVHITSQTQILSSNSVVLPLSALQNGAMLQVSGTAAGSEFTAVMIRDLSL